VAANASGFQLDDDVLPDADKADEMIEADDSSRALSTSLSVSSGSSVRVSRQAKKYGLWCAASARSFPRDSRPRTDPSSHCLLMSSMTSTMFPSASSGMTHDEPH